MADFLLELYSEEIPAGMQAGAAAQLERHIKEFLTGLGVEASGLAGYVAPQRVAVLADGLPSHLPDRKEEKKGPRVDAPQKAIDGFLRANGMDSTDGLSICDDKKGAFYILEIDEPGRPLAAALAEFLPDMVRDFQWPKSMRWGTGSLRWVRPLRSILCVFDGQVVDFEVGGLKAGAVTYGHRFMAPDALTVTRAADYLGTLEAAYVLADAPVREAMIAEGAAQLAADTGCAVVEDGGLMRETAGLVEWPIPLLGKIDDAFMDVPEEVLISVMRTHQKYFALRTYDGTDDDKDDGTDDDKGDGKGDGKLAPYFITVANMQTDDDGAAIIAGNERVLRARLSDSRFFWDQDRKETLESRLPALEKVTFHAKLGTMAEKAVRIANLAAELAAPLGADSMAAEQAGRLCKADLTSGMVYEFPELQGIMGGYYAQHDGLGDAVAEAIRNHYSPQGPGDAIPATAEGRSVALADKIDTLVGFWSIDEKPTGSKDPYALRRAALGIIRILLESGTRLSLTAVFDKSFGAFGAFGQYGMQNAPTADLLGFVADRLKVHLRDQEIAHDVVSAVFALGLDDVVELAKRAEHLAGFLAGDDGANLKAAFNRAHGICTKAAHEATTIDTALLVETAEKRLHQAIENLTTMRVDDIDSYAPYLDGLATLRTPVDNFFEAVMVNDDDAKIRHNRLSLLRGLIQQMRRAAAFDLIE